MIHSLSNETCEGKLCFKGRVCILVSFTQTLYWTVGTCAHACVHIAWANDDETQCNVRSQSVALNHITCRGGCYNYNIMSKHFLYLQFWVKCTHFGSWFSQVENCYAEKEFFSFGPSVFLAMTKLCRRFCKLFSWWDFTRKIYIVLGVLYVEMVRTAKCLLHEFAPSVDMSSPGQFWTRYELLWRVEVCWDTVCRATCLTLVIAFLRRLCGRRLYKIALVGSTHRELLLVRWRLTYQLCCRTQGNHCLADQHSLQLTLLEYGGKCVVIIFFTFFSIGGIVGLHTIEDFLSLPYFLLGLCFGLGAWLSRSASYLKAKAGWMAMFDLFGLRFSPVMTQTCKSLQRTQLSSHRSA